MWCWPSAPNWAKPIADVLCVDGNLRINGTLIRNDIDPEQLNRNFTADVAILSDARIAIHALLAGIGNRTIFSPTSPGTRRGRGFGRAWKRTASWLGQRRTLEILPDTLPEVIVAGDSTQPVYSGNHLYDANRPRLWFNSATGYGTLGMDYQRPAGRAGACRVVVGRDGGLQFTLPELASAVEAGAAIIILLWNNRGYGEIKRYMQSRAIPAIGVDIYTPDFLAVAKGFGCRAERAASFEHLHQLLQSAARAGCPTLIELLEEAQFLSSATA